MRSDTFTDLGRLRPRFHPLQVGSGVSVLVATGEDARDEISLALARGEFALPPHYDLLLGELRRGEVVLDLGAHIGTFSLAAAAHGLQVVAVEASPQNVALLERAADQQQMGDRLRVIWAAVADRPGSVRFLEAGPYGHVVVSPGEGGTVEVPAMTVDQLVCDLGLGAIAAVKLDVEGSEPLAVRGMAGLLTGPAPPLLVYECNGHTLHLFGQTPADLLSALAGLGYPSYAVRPGGLCLARPESPQWDCVVDYLALRRPSPRCASLSFLAEPKTADSLAEMEFFAHHPNPHYRAHVARTLNGWTARPTNQADPIARVLAALHNDPDPTVRAVVGDP